jgi:hypothetical protein
MQSLSHQLLNITKEKHAMLEKVYQLTCQQSEAIQEKQFEVFLSLSREKQELIDKLNELNLLFQQQYDVAKKCPNGVRFPQILSKHIDLKEMQNIIADINVITEKVKLRELKNKEDYKKLLLDMTISVTQSMANRQDKIARYKKMNDYKKKWKEKNSN